MQNGVQIGELSEPPGVTWSESEWTEKLSQYDLPDPVSIEEVRAKKIAELELQTRAFLDSHYDLRFTDALMLFMMKAQSAGNTQAVEYIGQAFEWGAGVTVSNATAIGEASAAETIEQIESVTINFEELSAADPKVNISTILGML